MYFETIFVIIFLVFGLSTASTLFYITKEPIAVTYEDKTAKTVQDALVVGKPVYTGRDLLSVIMVMDEFVPYPRKIRINDGPVILLDNAFITNIERKVLDVYATYLVGKDDLPLTFSYDYNGGYIQYRLG